MNDDTDLGRDIDLERAAYQAEDDRFLVSGPLADGEFGFDGSNEPEHDEDVEGAMREVRRG